MCNLVTVEERTYTKVVRVLLHLLVKHIMLLWIALHTKVTSVQQQIHIAVAR